MKMGLLDSLGLGKYEVEPLHDLKGHLSNIIEEAMVIGNDELKGVLKLAKETVLSKQTLRGSDYRKALILICIKLKETTTKKCFIDLFMIAMRISEALYATDEKSSPKNYSGIAQ